MIQRPKPGRERTAEELIRELRDIARIGIVNARRDAEILRQAADWIENAEERMAIMADSMAADDEHIHSGLISED